MKKVVFVFLLSTLHWATNAQDYAAQILQYREGYKMSLMKGEHAMKPEDTGYLRFYTPDPAYRVKATFEQVTGTVPFRLGVKNKTGDFGPEVRDYGIVYFNMNGATITMHVYRIVTKPVFMGGNSKRIKTIKCKKCIFRTRGAGFGGFGREVGIKQSV